MEGGGISQPVRGKSCALERKGKKGKRERRANEEKRGKRKTDVFLRGIERNFAFLEIGGGRGHSSVRYTSRI